MALLTTKEAALKTGLSEYELRLGFKQGRYPALCVGNESQRSRRLRWNLEILEEAIAEQMKSQKEELN